MSLDLEELIEELRCFSLDLRSAILGADFYMKLRGKGEEIEIFDCLIAANIISNDYKRLMTDNRSHFKRLKEIELIDF